MSEIIAANAENFEQEIIKSTIPVSVTFYSEECPPCDALAPIVDHAEERYQGKMKFARVLRQHNRELAEKLSISSSPTVLFYKNGQEVCQRLTGYIKKSELRKAVEEVLGDTCPRPERHRYDCDALVLGGGPAGITATIYLARAKLKTVMVDEGLPGGQVATTFHISNYPGTGGTVRGIDLMRNMVDQAMSFGATIDALDEVQELKLTGDIKYVRTELADYYARSIIISTGAEPRRLPAEGEREFRGRGVHYCATCDGALYQDRKLIVVGGGNSAVQEAVYLTRFASHVTVLHQLDHFQASQVAQDELFRNPNIDVIWNAEVRQIKGEGVVKKVVIENLQTRTTEEIATDGIFVYIGMEPRTEPFRDQVRVNDAKYIMTDENLRTSLEGVFAAGDVREKAVRQIATAVGDGAIAGLMAEKYIVGSQNPSGFH